MQFVFLYMPNIVFFYDALAVNGRLNVNVALNRPAFMPSILDDPSLGGLFSPSNAVDGNKDSVAYKTDNSCIHTLSETNPWWAVDLGSALNVVCVLLTNRADGWGNASIRNSNTKLRYLPTSVHICV